MAGWRVGGKWVGRGREEGRPWRAPRPRASGRHLRKGSGRDGDPGRGREPGGARLVKRGSGVGVPAGPRGKTLEDLEGQVPRRVGSPALLFNRGGIERVRLPRPNSGVACGRIGGFGCVWTLLFGHCHLHFFVVVVI